MREQILVVDDEAEIADLVGLYLQNEGFAVCKCHTAAGALESLAREQISLAVLDVMLPDMDGFALCRQIRQSHLFPFSCSQPGWRTWIRSPAFLWAPTII